VLSVTLPSVTLWKEISVKIGYDVGSESQLQAGTKREVSSVL